MKVYSEQEELQLVQRLIDYACSKNWNAWGLVNGDEEDVNENITGKYEPGDLTIERIDSANGLYLMYLTKFQADSPRMMFTINDLIFLTGFAEAVFGNDIVEVCCGCGHLIEDKVCCPDGGHSRFTQKRWQYNIQTMAILPEQNRLSYLEGYLEGHKL